MKDWPVRRMSLDELAAAPYNPRVISEKAKGGLARSLGRFGCVEPVVWNERTGNLVGGHQRVEVLREAGESEVDVVVVDLDDQEEVALNITLNNPMIEGDWTAELRGMLEGVDEGVREALGFDLLEAFAEMGEPKEPKAGGEIDIGSLTPDDAEVCPGCGFRWVPDAKDEFELGE